MGDVRTTPRAKARRIVTRMFWRVGDRWYGFTSLFRGRHGHPVKVATSVDEIAARLRIKEPGDMWVADPLDGKLDVLKHPRLVQRAIDERRPVGDCDDHAGYWCSVLLKSGLATDVYFATLQMADEEGPSGHAFALFQVEGDRRWFSADYFAPAAHPNPRAAILAMAESFGALPLIGTWKRVELRRNDGLRRVRGGGEEVWRG